MPRRVRHYDQPQLAPSAGDLGTEAYQANLADAPGPDRSDDGDIAGTVPAWDQAEPRNTPPNQERNDTQKIRIGHD